MAVIALTNRIRKSDSNRSLGETKGVGGYSEYTLADERLCFKVPPNIRREEAVTAPLAACMAYLGLFSKSYLNMNITGPDASVLIWGASCKYKLPSTIHLKLLS